MIATETAEREGRREGGHSAAAHPDLRWSFFQRWRKGRPTSLKVAKAPPTPNLFPLLCALLELPSSPTRPIDRGGAARQAVGPGEKRYLIYDLTDFSLAFFELDAAAAAAEQAIAKAGREGGREEGEIS